MKGSNNPSLDRLKRHIRLFDHLQGSLAELLGEIDQGKSYSDETEDTRLRVICLMHDLAGESEDSEDLPPSISCSIDFELQNLSDLPITIHFSFADREGDWVRVDLQHQANTWKLTSDLYAHGDDQQRALPVFYAEILERLEIKAGSEMALSSRRAYRMIRSFCNFFHEVARRDV